MNFAFTSKARAEGGQFVDDASAVGVREAA